MSIRKRILRIIAVLGIVLFLAVIAILASGWSAFGTTAEGIRLERMTESPQWRDGVFENPQPLWNDTMGWFTSWSGASDVPAPRDELPVVTGNNSRFATPPASGLRLTWLGHSTVLIEIDGTNLLLDPIWGDRPSPFTWAGPMRWYPPPVALDDLPEIDAVVISHDHYDHLDYPTLVQMKDWDSKFVVPLGVGAHLEYWGIPADRIVELDWWDTAKINTIELACLPSRHASGRFVNDYMHTLWAGYGFIGPKHRVYYSGDTGPFPAMKEIGEKYGPFDVTMIEVGAYHRTWPDWHIGPEQAVKAHHLVGGKVFLPVHWGMWDLALHGWTEPAERVVAEAKKQGTTLAMPRPGESVEPANLKPFEKWWPDEPWETAEQHPIVSTKIDGMFP